MSSKSVNVFQAWVSKTFTVEFASKTLDLGLENAVLEHIPAPFSEPPFIEKLQIILNVGAGFDTQPYAHADTHTHTHH